MADNPTSSLLSDRPAQEDALDFEPYRQTLAGIIADPNTDTPMTIGVFGPWGSGKTTLLDMVKRDVEADHVAVWFTAWKYDDEEVLWRALLVRVIAAVRKAAETGAKSADAATWARTTEELDELDETLYHAIERVEQGRIQVDPLQLGKGVVQTVTQGVLASIPGFRFIEAVVDALGEGAATTGPKALLDAFSRAQKKVTLDRVESLEQFEDRLKDVIERHVAPKKLVVFVDDLDRCLPEKAVDVLEGIKLFLDVEGCVFVLGMARDVITNGIRIRYGALGEYIDGERYLEKLIQIPFDLPPLESESVLEYLQKLAPSLPDPRCLKVFAAGLGQPNPRRVKRMVNSYLFLQRLAEACVDRLGPLEDVRLAKIVAIQHGDPALFGLLRLAPHYLVELDAYYRKKPKAKDASEAEGTPDGDGLPESLRRYAGHQGLQRLLGLYSAEPEACFAGLDESQVRPYFSLTRSVAAPDEGHAQALPYVPELVSIPGGTFTMGTTPEDIETLKHTTDWSDEFDFSNEQPHHDVTLTGYQIGRDPVTNAQYQAFVQASDDHNAPSHWQGDEPPDEIRDHPVTYVSWDEAVAYCQWLSTRTGRSFRLPTEAEWEMAAHGSEHRLWPWGDTWDASRCNTSEQGPGATTPVGHYWPRGDSPFGCRDMAGNVWERCLDWYDSSYYQGSPAENPPGPETGNRHVVRGGSWGYDQRLARCAYRLNGNPNDRGFNFGFRVVVAPPISRRS